MTYKTQSILILLGTLLIGIIVGALGSGLIRGERERRFEHMLPRERFYHFMERVIRPTDQQREQFEHILQKRSEQLAKLVENHEDQMFAIYDSMRTELTSILTDEQRRRFEAELAKGSNRLAEKRLIRLAKELNLSREQVEKIRNIYREILPKPEDMRWRGDRSRGEFREKYRQAQDEIRQVLTPEQWQKYQKLRFAMRPPFRRGRFPRSFFGPEGKPPPDGEPLP